MGRTKLLHGAVATFIGALLAITAAAGAAANNGNGNGKGNGGGTTTTSTTTSSTTTTSTTMPTTTSTTTPSVPTTIVAPVPPAIPTTGDELARCVGLQAGASGASCAADFTLTETTWVKPAVTKVGHFGDTYTWIYRGGGGEMVLSGPGSLPPGSYRLVAFADPELTPSGACALNRCVNSLPRKLLGAGVITATLSR